MPDIMELETLEVWAGSAAVDLGVDATNLVDAGTTISSVAWVDDPSGSLPGGTTGNTDTKAWRRFNASTSGAYIVTAAITFSDGQIILVPVRVRVKAQPS